MIQWPRHASSPELEHAVAPQGIRVQHEAKMSLTLCETLQVLQGISTKTDSRVTGKET